MAIDDKNSEEESAKNESEILDKKEVEKLDDLDWSDITNEIIRNKEMLREGMSQDVFNPTVGDGNSASSPSVKTSETVDLTFLNDVPLKLTVEVGSRRIPMHEILRYKIGDIIELNSVVGETLKIFVNDVLVGFGLIIEKELKYGIKITSLLDEKQRMEALSAQAFFN